MSMELASGWQMELDRGPDWMYVRLLAPEKPLEDRAEVAQGIWHLLEQEFTYRLVLELDGVFVLDSHLLGELVKLNRRIQAQGGMLRICGLSSSNLEVLKISQLTAQFPHYESRADAIMGHDPGKPR